MPEPSTTSQLRRWMWWIAAAVSLVAGYADLWRGGETLAPVLLVLGYCVLVPVAIIARGPEAPASRASRS